MFDLAAPDEYGAFLNLVQHHGYPTPFLDWTRSPYVAAFFAFRTVNREQVASAEKVRIHVFDQGRWRQDWNQVMLIDPPRPHVSVGEFIAIENERMIPQQSVSIVTSIDDVETYVRSKESKDKRYLWALDVPMRERDKVVQELRYMGTTAGALFPGLDGECEELRERNFDL